MKIINLKEMYSNYYIRKWKKQGLRLITERPPTTTQEALDNFFRSKTSPDTTKYQLRAIRKEKRRTRLKRLDWRDYLKEEYKWKNIKLIIQN